VKCDIITAIFASFPDARPMRPLASTGKDNHGE